MIHSVGEGIAFSGWSRNGGGHAPLASTLSRGGAAAHATHAGTIATRAKHCDASTPAPAPPHTHTPGDAAEEVVLPIFHADCQVKGLGRCHARSLHGEGGGGAKEAPSSASHASGTLRLVHSRKRTRAPHLAQELHAVHVLEHQQRGRLLHVEEGALQRIEVAVVRLASEQRIAGGVAGGSADSASARRGVLDKQ